MRVEDVEIDYIKHWAFSFPSPSTQFAKISSSSWPSLRHPELSRPDQASLRKKTTFFSLVGHWEVKNVKIHSQCSFKSCLTRSNFHCWTTDEVIKRSPHQELAALVATRDPDKIGRTTLLANLAQLADVVQWWTKICRWLLSHCSVLCDTTTDFLNQTFMNER